MAQAKSLRIRVASGVTVNGSPWSLWWPRWQWARLSPAEQQATIRRQKRLMELGRNDDEESVHEE